MSNYIFQINRKTDFQLLEMLEEMEKNKELEICFDQRLEHNAHLVPGDKVYLWESGNHDALHLLAYGEVIDGADPMHPRTMPIWQQAFCVDGVSGAVGDSSHDPHRPRAKILVKGRLPKGKRVQRQDTDPNSVLRTNSFLRNGTGSYQRTIVPIDAPQAAELDRIAQWVPL